MTERAELTIETTVGSLQTGDAADMLVETLHSGPTPVGPSGVDVRLTVVGAPGTRTRALTVVPADDPSVVRFGRPNRLGQVTFRGLSRGPHHVTVLPAARLDRAARVPSDGTGQDPAFPLPAPRALAATGVAGRRLRSADGRTTVELITVGRVLWGTVTLDRDCRPDEVFLLPFECAAESGSVRRLVVALGSQEQEGRPTGTVRVGDPAAQDWFDVGDPVGPDGLSELVAIGSDPAWRTVVEESVKAAAYPADQTLWNAVLDRLPADHPDDRLRAVLRDALARW